MNSNTWSFSKPFDKNYGSKSMHLQEVVTELREFLPQAEAQLKFKAVPEDEGQVLLLIDKHRRFEEELQQVCFLLWLAVCKI